MNQSIWSRLGKAAKAFYSAGIAFLGTLYGVMLEDQSFSDVSAKQWVFIASVTLTAWGGTYWIKNNG
jgi:hypothetical protein